MKSENDPGNLQLTPTNLIADLSQRNVCRYCCPSVSVPRARKEFAPKRKHIYYVHSDVADRMPLRNNLDCSSNSLASMSSSNPMSMYVGKVHPIPLSKSSSDFREMFNSDLEQSGDDSPVLPSMLNVDPGMISLSKSETNIFEGNNPIKFALYDVVSLNDLDEVDPFPALPMIDLTKNQLLNNISKDEIITFKK